jgi:bifunctional UDP-N-acetylglucosamine pyrophosphorylase/glucosamine-1-phosphate N-acetyltransferase
VIEPFCALTGATAVGGRCHIDRSSTLIDARLGEEVTVRQSWLQSCELHDCATVGPFAYLRPGARLREGAKAGTFVTDDVPDGGLAIARNRQRNVEDYASRN